MNKIYSSPFRVYLCVMAFAFLGIYTGLDLPISLYPNSSQPLIGAGVPYGSLTASEFLNQYGYQIESNLKNISEGSIEVDQIEANYRDSRVTYQVRFKWGTKPNAAKREVKAVMTSLSANWPKEIRERYWVNFWGNNGGFIAISFFSEKRSINELFDILDPVITPKLSKVKDAENPGLWNPNRKEIRIELDINTMTALGLLPSDVENAIRRELNGYRGGHVVMGKSQLSIKMPRSLVSIEAMESLLIKTSAGNLIPLSRIARVDFAKNSSHTKIFKTNGSKSLLLFAKPRTGGNVKEMAEQIIEIVETSLVDLPEDIQYRTLVDPSGFIRSSIENVMHEVFIAAGLAVLVLFMFIGSLKNTITAAIEIPLSMVLAFILMKLTGMNINLISLGGLALSAGMNVDASVVVMENIFRHFEDEDKDKILTLERKLEIIINAVKEVSLPVIASTIASLVVFIPLAFTSDLTNAILGDLAKAVVFSHGFSAFVALILVPTIRLQIFSFYKEKEETLSKSPIEGVIKKVENAYSRGLEKFIESKRLKWGVLSGAMITLALLVIFALPNLKREIIGLPDTDWIILVVKTNGNTVINQMENTTSEVESRLLNQFGDKIKYTFTQIRNPNRGQIMARLKNKSEMDNVWKTLQKHFVNTPDTFYFVVPWNPAELPIPNPPQMRIVVKGGELEDRAMASKALLDELRGKDVFSQRWSDPSVRRRENIVLKPRIERWTELVKKGISFGPFDLIDISRVATEGKIAGYMNVEGKSYDIFMKYSGNIIETKEDLESLPIKVGKKIVPFKSLTEISVEKAKPEIYRENGKTTFVIWGKQNKGEESKKEEALALAKEVVQEFQKTGIKKLELESEPKFYFEDSEKELSTALEELGVAIGLSILLIFAVLLFQFGSVVHTLIVLTAIPTGIMGVLLSLLIFQSTLSLNSALGVILLNGISVANSIILVDFIRKLVAKGFNPKMAALIAAKKRLRPILITSLTTILGMLPIAVGLGDGGKILSPLGISVSGGLWISMLFTLFMVPMFEVLYLERKMKGDMTISGENQITTALNEQEQAQDNMKIEMEKSPDGERKQ